MMSSPSPVFSMKAERIYKINGAGCYSMQQVIEEYIKYKLDGGFPFNSIFSVGNTSDALNLHHGFITC